MEPFDVGAWRRETRNALIERRLRMTPAEHLEAGDVICGYLDEILTHLPVGTVSAYWPFKGEVDIRELIQKFRLAGWHSALPVVVGPGHPLEFHRWEPDAVMDKGVYQIPIPKDRNPVRPDVVITPLVGFDAANYRLGYGAAYFDITLGALNPRPVTIGVGFEVGRLPTIYPLPTDIPMDTVVTEAGIQRLPSSVKTS